MKSHYRIESMPSAKEPIVQALVLASVITQIVGGELLVAVRRRLRDQAARLKEERWASLFATVATSVLDVMTMPARAAGALARPLEAMLLHEAIDPNAQRPAMIRRVDMESVWSR